MAFVSGIGTANVGGLSGSGNITLTDLGAASVMLSVSGAGNTTYSGILSGGGS